VRMERETGLEPAQRYFGTSTTTRPCTDIAGLRVSFVPSGVAGSGCISGFVATALQQKEGSA
jgi:hypothetical protein